MSGKEVANSYLRIHDPSLVKVCTATMVKGVAHLPKCVGTFTLTSVAGVSEYSCSKLSSIVLHGPAVITTKECTAVAEGLPLGIKSISSDSTIEIILLTLLLVIMLIQVLFLRYWWIVKAAAVSGRKIEGREPDEENGKLVFRVGKDMRAGPQIVMRRPVIKLTKLQLVLWLLFLHSPVPVEMKEFTGSLSVGHTFYIGDEVAHLDKSEMNFPLTKLYNTFIWHASTDSDWHTMNDDCEKHIMCDGSLPFGLLEER